MRIHVVRDRVHVRLEHVVRGELGHALVGPLVTLLERFFGVLPLLAGEYQAQRVALDVLPPNLVELLRRCRPGQHAAIPAIRLVDGEVRLGVEQHDRVVDSLRRALAEEVEHVEDWLELAAASPVVELVPEAVEARDIRRGEVHSVAVQRIEVAVENRGRQRVVEMWLRVVQLFDELGDVTADRRLLWIHLDRLQRLDRRVRHGDGR